MSDRLDSLLNASSPATAEPDLTPDFAQMIAAARVEARPARRLPRLVATGSAVALLLGGAGAAAAVTLGGWQPWAEHPDDSYTYTLPSGAHCESRIGNFVGDDAELLTAIKAYLGSVDILALADVDSAIADIREGESYLIIGNTKTPSGYGTEYYDADSEYQQAVDTAVSTVLYDEMRRQGYTIEGGLHSFEGETHCDA